MVIIGIKIHTQPNTSGQKQDFSNSKDHCLSNVNSLFLPSFLPSPIAQSSNDSCTSEEYQKNNSFMSYQNDIEHNEWIVQVICHLGVR